MTTSTEETINQTTIKKEKGKETIKESFKESSKEAIKEKSTGKSKEKRFLKIKWDGSHLGEFKHDIICGTCEINGDRYCKFNINDHIFYAHIKTVTDNISCLVDELKELFGLRKLGTHTVRIHSKLYLLIKANTIKSATKNEMSIIEDISINKVAINPTDNVLFQREVQKIVVFRELLGISAGGRNIIRIRYDLDGPYPLSYIENNIDYDKHKITLQIYRKWFADLSISDILPKIVNYGDDLTETIAQYRGEIEKVITRVNKDYIWISSFIVNRMMDKLT